MDPAEAVRQAVEALRNGRPAVAAEVLAPVVDRIRGDDLEDVRARVLTLFGQSLVAVDRTDEAEAPLREALAIARRLGDDAGVAAIRELIGQCASATADHHRKAQEHRVAARLAAVPIASLLATAIDDVARADVHLRKANAAIEVGRAQEGEAFAREALRLALAAGLVREEVLARLSLARAAPDGAGEQITAALERAASAGEANLVGAIARTAELLGIAIPAEPIAGHR